MPDKDPKLLVCNCEGSMALDGVPLSRACDREIQVHHQLCRAEIGTFRTAAAAGGALLVCCTQEAPLFEETLEDLGDDAATVSYVNIRERAGWSDESAAATPKIAALIAEAGVAATPPRGMTLVSSGRALIYGVDEAALDAAAQLAGRLDVTVMLTGDAVIAPVASTVFPIYAGTITRLAGHLGAFEVAIDGFARARPASRAALAFEEGRDGVSLDFDMVIDLTGAAALMSAPEKRDGYLRADPASPALVQKTLFDAADLVGEFEKPIYVDYDPNICAHSRSAITGCARCIDACPASAISPAGDIVAFDHHACAGCGGCASVCPTGAARYVMPGEDVLTRRLRTLLDAYRRAGGGDAVLLVHDDSHGAEMVAAMARHGRGLPARVLPFAVNEVTQIGFNVLAAAIAYGADAVVVLAPPSRRDELDGLRDQAGLVEAALVGLGYDGERIRLVDETDPDGLADYLYGIATPANRMPPAEFLPMGGKRTLAAMALEHIHRYAPAPTDILALPPGAPFGGVAVKADGCTLCMSCVGGCPTGALKDNPDAPMLRFIEQACVQCGLCRNICPESVISLEPRFNFTTEAGQEKLLKEEEPFLCISCGEPFAAKSAIERTVARLADHPMFADDPAGLDRLRMCENCRVVAQFGGDQPMAQGAPRLPRTTEDYLAGKFGDDEDQE